MPFKYGTTFRLLLLVALFSSVLSASGQSGNAGTVRGTVVDTSGAVIPGATVRIANSVSGLDRSATSDATGQFTLANIPFNQYQISVSANGFASLTQSVE